MHSGGSHNRRFIADTINYTERAETPPEYTGTYSYTSLQAVTSYVARPNLQKQVGDCSMRVPPEQFKRALSYWSDSEERERRIFL